jgi:CO/xanthine dehydrogenase Mo-binding subunit
VGSCGVEECIEKAAEAIGWKEMKQRHRAEGHVARGVGIAAGAYLSGARLSGHNACSAIVRVCEDGSVNLVTGSSDVGQGSDTAMCAMVAEVLGLEIEDVEIKRVDTDYTPVDPGSYGSRVTVFAGDATKRAAEDVRNQLMEVAAREFGVGVGELDIKNKEVFVKADPTQRMPWWKLVRMACYTTPGNVIIGKGVSTKGIGPLSNWKTGVGDAGINYSFTAEANEVEVDLETGVARCTDRSVIAHDCGIPLNPTIVETQVAGGAYCQGIAAALYEEFKMDQGLTLNPNLVDYKRARAYEAPMTQVIHVITDDPFGPFGAKECSEGSVCTAPPAIINAIHDATGVWIKEIPATPERIWRALKAKK